MPDRTYKRILKLSIPLLYICSLSACSLQCSDEILTEPDLSPPRLLEISPTMSPEVRIIFDEAVFPENEKITLDTGDRASLSTVEGNIIVLLPEKPLIPGKQYKAGLTVEDISGNSCRFVLPFWGWNPDVPDLLINEFNPEGSGNNPDCIEFYVVSGGNSAGMCLYYGTKKHYEFRYILPALELATGEYLTIHCRREYDADEISERDDKTLSTGKLSSEEAWDIWLPEDAGLSGANGILSIYNAPEGIIQDGVVYSERVSNLEDDRLGWTSRTFDAAADLFQGENWVFSSELIPPEEAIASHYTTGTRSLCRSSNSTDTDRKEDWHTVPTGGKSFGTANSDEIYVVPP
jgi:hypothetical protein